MILTSTITIAIRCNFPQIIVFIVSQLGIKIEPSKVKAITEMPAPRTEKEVRHLLGRFNYISGFIAKLTTTCKLLFKLLQENGKIV